MISLFLEANADPEEEGETPHQKIRKIAKENYLKAAGLIMMPRGPRRNMVRVIQLVSPFMKMAQILMPEYFHAKPCPLSLMAPQNCTGNTLVGYS